MSRLNRFFALTLTLSCGLAITACSDDPDTPANTTGSNTNSAATGTVLDPNASGGISTNSSNPNGTNTSPAPACDPVGANPAMGALLNKPPAPGVILVPKKPTHPGNPGPVGLP